MIKDKKILIGITGSIAAYKIINLVRLLIKEGAEVKVIQTPSSRDFVSPLVLSTLSKNTVLSDMFKEGDWSNHVQLGRWADVMLIAPASCNTIAKMAAGICDNLLLATYLSATCPVVVAPAMDEDMWLHKSTQNNLEALRAHGNKVLSVNTGELASGLYGPGRMSEPEEILNFLKNEFFGLKKFHRKKVLITAGPTHEPLDPVRFIGNHSSGKMGFALAQAFHSAGAEVILVSGPTELRSKHHDFNVVKVNTAAEMFDAVMQRQETAEILVMAAAVADYSPTVVEENKIKKKNGTFTVELTKTKDILKNLGERKKGNQYLIGFALETENEIANAQEKLNSKNADLIVLNSLREEGAGFGVDTNAVTLLFNTGDSEKLPLASKETIAKTLVNIVAERIYEKV